jgi:predicted nucleotidyltransferase
MSERHVMWSFSVIRGEQVNAKVDVREEWIAALRRWAARNDNICALWIFGSRAKGIAHSCSDIDIALELMPPNGRDNWALANFFERFDDWKSELREAVAWPVSLVAIGPKFDMDAEVRASKAKSNLSRTLRTMEGYGLVRLDRDERGRITPKVMHDRVELDLPLTLSRKKAIIRSG